MVATYRNVPAETSRSTPTQNCRETDYESRPIEHRIIKVMVQAMGEDRVKANKCFTSALF